MESLLVTQNAEEAYLVNREDVMSIPEVEEWDWKQLKPR